ncbi:MAG TPA: hypothetical protein VKZ98_03105 [Aquaticitalea sp.]|nr:hypothetical protein [Aquaticitalea sp.]
MKSIRKILIIVLAFVVVVTAYYSIERYFINDNLKGINPNHILSICLFLILPISLSLFIIKKKK